MAIPTVALTNTFDEWRIRTNQVINSLNTINEANAALTGSITITNPSRFNSNVSLNVSSGMIKGDGGLLTNLQSSIVATAAYNTANAAYVAANAAPQSSRVNSIYSLANAAFDAANGAGTVAISNTAPIGPSSGDFWWKSDIGRLLIYYNDGDTSQWVDASPAGGPGIIYDTANAAFVKANAGFTRANAGYTQANAAYTYANTVAVTTHAAYDQANSATVAASSAGGIATGAFGVANAAFDKANTSTGGTTVKLGNESSSSETFYVTLANTSSGNVSTLNVSSSSLTFIPSTGTLSATVFNSLSDATLKNDIEPISNALEIINKISGVGFNWKESGKHSFGVVAQNMEEVVPDLVGNINNHKTVNYDGIIAFLIEAIKELNNKLENKE